MALSGPTLLTADPDTSNVSSYVTPSVSPSANALIVVGVWTTDGTSATLPTLSSGFTISGSWTQEATILASASTRRLTIFSAQTGGSPGSGTITADYGGDAQTGTIIIAVEFTGHDTTTPTSQPTTNEGGAGGATSLSITLGSALSSANDKILAFIGHNTQEDQTAGGGGTELASSDVGYATPAAEMAVYYETNDNSVSASWATSSAKLAAALEINESASLVDADAEVSFSELEVPFADASAQVSFTEFEVPTADADAEISFAEVEVPFADASAQTSFTELQVPDAGLADADAEVSWAEVEVPFADASAQISFTEVEVPFADSDAEISHAELEVPFADARADVSWAELQIPLFGEGGTFIPDDHPVVKSRR